MIDNNVKQIENHHPAHGIYLGLLFGIVLTLLPAWPTEADEPSYPQAQSILIKYCAGCHNEDDANGEFALDSFEAMLKGGESGNALTAGSAASSRMIQLMNGKLEPKMPPDGEPAPSDDEIQVVADWIEAGALGPEGNSVLPTKISAPKIASHANYQPVTAMAFSGNQERLAVARYGKIEILNANSQNIQQTLSDLPGKVTALRFLKDDQFLLAGTGIAGLYGEAVLYDLANDEMIRRFRGHRDMVYSVAINADETLIATSGYDRKSVLWDVDSDTPLRTFTGHNDAVFENTFDLTGDLLITASADATIKVWRVSDGKRLDTRGEPLKEQYTVAISPDGSWIFAGGEDNRIRKWQLVSRRPNQTNPLAVARFAHEAAIQLLRFHADGKHLISVASDGVIKIWEIAGLTERFRFDDQTESVQAMAVGKDRIVVGRMDGSVDILDWPSEHLSAASVATAERTNERTVRIATETELNESTEVEPNDVFEQATRVEAPFSVSGIIDADDRTDVDCFRFNSRQDEHWIIETKARQDKSPLDTQVAILDSDGQPVPRVLLRAVRDSYVTFRGKNSKQVDDFRVHNWAEMRLNQLLYLNGEVVKLYHYPRGPDSGFNLYPNFGNRHAMFDTTPIAHALGEPCYVVEAHPPGSVLPATGLPQFLLNYENDDDARQELGSDSRLTFVAPHEGEYVVRVRDARDFQGQDFSYRLIVRPPTPGFSLNKIDSANPTLMRGAFKKIEIKVDRVDNFAGPIAIEVENLPEGVTAAGPITIEENGLRAFFVLHASEDAPSPGEATTEAQVTATAVIYGKQVRSSQSLGKIKFGEDPKLFVELAHAADGSKQFNDDGIPIVEIRPGETVTARIHVARRGYDNRINFGKEDAALNLPFGVYVDNTGLNGVLIPAKETERTIFLTAEEWVQPCERLIFLESEEAGRPASNPALLRVMKK